MDEDLNLFEPRQRFYSALPIESKYKLEYVPRLK